MEDFLLYEFGGLISGGAYTWRGLFSEFYGILNLHIIILTVQDIYLLCLQLSLRLTSCGERNVNSNRVLHLSTKIQQKDTVLDFVFGSSTGNRITSFRLRRLVPRVLRLLTIDTKFSIELLFQRNSCIAEKYGDTGGKAIKIAPLKKGQDFNVIKNILRRQHTGQNQTTVLILVYQALIILADQYTSNNN